MEPPSRFKVPAGSLLIDGALVVALIWSQATTTETMRGMDLRVAHLERITQVQTDMDARISVVEAIQSTERQTLVELKQDIVKRLDRIETKLDQIR